MLYLGYINTGNALQLNFETRSHNNYCRRKATNITYSECVSVVSVVQHAKRMHRIVICDLSGCTVFFLIISKTARFAEKRLLNMKYVFWFSVQISSEKFLILRTRTDIMIIKLDSSSCKVPVILVRLKKTGAYTTFPKNTEISNFMKIHLVGSTLFHADGRKDRHVINSRLLQFFEGVYKLIN